MGNIEQEVPLILYGLNENVVNELLNRLWLSLSDEVLNAMHFIKFR